MEKEFEIELDPVEEETPETSEETVETPAEEETADIPSLPMNFLSFGETKPNDVKVYIKQNVYKTLEKHSAADTTTERGSILVGDYVEAHGTIHVIISGAIEAKYTDASATTLTFTHETWDYVHKEHQRKFKDQKIVGWQHSHPSYGIFLSNYDLFIQENFFTMPFQVAYVIDPVQNIRGFFQWKDGKVEKLGGYYIYDEIGKPIKISQVKPKKEEEEPKPAKQSSLLTWLLCAAVVILAICMIGMNNRYQEALETQQNEILLLQTTVSGHEQTIANQQSQLENQGIALQEQAQTIESLQAPAEDAPEAPDEETAPAEEAVTFLSYTVQAGDSLEGICRAHGIDYAANWRVILSVNGISDPNRIYIGQTILLPVNP